MREHDGTRRRAWVEVDLDALERNYQRLASPPGTSGEGGPALLPMLKADGYGLGAVRVMEALRHRAPWAFGVATTEEGRELREAGYEGRIVVFSAGPLRDADALRRGRLEPAVSSCDGLEVYAERGTAARPVTVHLELDTGMGRLGLLATERGTWIERAREALEAGTIRVGSTFTHFHSAGSDPDATRAQWRLFRKAVADMERGGIDPGPLHAANSAAHLRYPDVRADLVRPGIFLYGGGGDHGGTTPEAVVALRARVLDVRTVPEGHTVSYGATYTTRGPARLATLGIGYGDGLRRELSNRGAALLEGGRAPIRGAVCMDLTVVEVTDVPGVRAGSVATLIGEEGGQRIDLGEVADQCDTLDYEILTGLTPRLPRQSLPRSRQ